MPLAILLTALFVLYSASVSWSATLYVDWDTGTDNSTCGDVASKCKTPWYTGSNRVASGDSVIIGAKDDGSPYNNGTSAVISASVSNVTWQAESGQTVRLSITVTFGDATWVGINHPVVGMSASGVVIDGFYIWGQVIIDANGSNSTLKNSDISGGNGGRDNFPAAVYFHGTIGVPASTCSAWADNVRVYNSKIHDNVSTSPEPNNGSNWPLVMFYCASNTIIENSEFYGAQHGAVFIKDHSNGQIVRYSWFHNQPKGIQGCGQYCNGPGDVRVYQNIFTNHTDMAIAIYYFGASSPLIEYNNDFYNNVADVGYWDSAYQLSHFNDIHYHSSASQYYHKNDQNWTTADFVYHNYNRYYSTSTTNWRINNINRASTLANWVSWLQQTDAPTGRPCTTATNCDDNSVEGNPNFLNGSGNFNTPTDFKRSSYPTDGRGGTWPIVMGAYITGNETIGLLPASTSGRPHVSRGGFDDEFAE